MPLDTYAGLVSAVPAWLGRPGDPFITGQIDTLIGLAEARFRNGAGGELGSPPLRLRAMETRDAAFSISAALTDLPDGFLELKRIKLLTSPVTPLDFMPAEEIDGRYAGSLAGQPLVWCIYADQLRVAPEPSGTYTAEIVYSSLPGLTEANGSNALLTAAPNVYLFGVLLEAALFLGNPEKAAGYHAQMQAAIEGLARSDRNARYAGATLRMRVAGSTP